MVLRILLLAFLSGNFSHIWSQGVISTHLQKEIQKTQGSAENIRIQVYMSRKADVAALVKTFREQRLSQDQRSAQLIEALQTAANEAQGDILNLADSWNANHTRKVEIIRQFYITNLIVLDAPVAFIIRLGDQPGIEIIESYNRYTLKYQPPVMSNSAVSRAIGGREPGLAAIHAPFMWNLGYTGLGRRLYTVDTGVWHRHPAINKQWRGTYLPQDWCWKGIDSPIPVDKARSHGTHVSGIVLGLNAQNADTIGVAFNATFMVSDPIVELVSEVKPMPEVFAAFEFALNPDGNASTSDDIPDVICNSWGRGDTFDISVCNAPFIDDILQALDALGVAVEFSAGNEGPGVATIALPAYATFDSLSIFSVGAVDGNNPAYPITDFSSRGPILCDVPGNLKIKPEVCAPGYNVRSSVKLNEYAEYSGTSMAGPHVAGAVLLLKEAFPFLSGRELLNALYQTAEDLGDPGEDNTYGRGIINLESAFNFLSLSNTPVPPNTSTTDIVLESILIPEIICSGTHTPQAVIFNAGQTTVSGGTIALKKDGTAQGSATWNGSVNPGERDTIDFPSVNFESGHHELFATLTPAQLFAEHELINNNRVKQVRVQPLKELPFSEGFEGTALPGDNWFVVNPDRNRTWDTTHTAGLENSRYSARMSFLSYIGQQATDDLLSPEISVPAGTDSFKLRFDVAYRFRNISLVDTLQIFISPDCGNTWQRIYNKGGLTLSTIDTLWTAFRPYKPHHWRTEHVDLKPMLTTGNSFLFRFRGINDGGCNLYLDNIGIYSTEDPTAVIEAFPEWSLYPNPASEEVSFRLHASTGETRYVLLDMQGRRVSQSALPAGQTSGTISMRGLRSGIYLFMLENGKGRSVKKLVKI